MCSDNLKDKNNEEKEVWKKIFMFTILFPPYALYLFLFKTKTSKYVKIIIVFFLGIILFFVVDTVRYPDRIHNEVVFEEISNLKKTKEININSVYYIDKRKEFEYQNNEYLSFNIFDENNMYYGIFEVKEYNKNYNLVYLYRLDKKEEILYDENKFIEFKEVHPIIFTEILTNDDLQNCEKISVVGDVEEKELFFNTKKQTLNMLGEDVVFKFNEFGVISYESKTGNIKSYKEENTLMTTNFTSVYKMIFKNFQDKFELVGYNYYNGKHVFNLEVGNNKYIIEYYYGQGVSLQSIEEEDLYMNFLNEYYEK